MRSISQKMALFCTCLLSIIINTQVFSQADTISEHIDSLAVNCLSAIKSQDFESFVKAHHANVSDFLETIKDDPVKVEDVKKSMAQNQMAIRNTQLIAKHNYEQIVHQWINNGLEIESLTLSKSNFATPKPFASNGNLLTTNLQLVFKDAKGKNTKLNLGEIMKTSRGWVIID